MGRESNTKKDRTCRICGDIRLRTAKEMKQHGERCLEELRIQTLVEKIGLVKA